MKVVVLAGGRGTRLGLTDLPKPMVPIGGSPLLERLVLCAKGCGYTEFVFLNGYLGGVVEKYFGDGADLGVRIEHVREERPLGTAGAVLGAKDLLHEPFVLLYGDVLIDVDLAHMAAEHGRSGADATLLVHPNSHPFDSDLVEVGTDGRVSRFLPKPHPIGEYRQNMVNAALYVLDPRCMTFVPDDEPSDWGRDIFPAMLREGRPVTAYRSLEYAKDIGTPVRLEAAERDVAAELPSRLSRRVAKPAVFLDRDGVLNTEIDGVYRPADLRPIAGAAAAVRRLNDSGVPAICVTNQPGLAKGLVDEERLREVFAALDAALADEGARLDDVMVCPHHPERGWPGEVAHLKIPCACRKPGAGMFFDAASRHNLDLSRSWVIGDRASDIAAARAAGARSVLVTTGHTNAAEAYEIDPAPDHVAVSLDEAVGYAIKALS